MKNEKGSITLFVVLAMLFIISIVFIAYTQMTNINIAQEKDIEKIMSEYQKNSNLKAMEERYQEIVENLKKY